jgi:plasmid maintenance system antidote protein VapI
MSQLTAARPNRPTRGQCSPLPPHGTAARGTGRPAQGIPGCKCQPCRDAKLKADSLRALANLSGRPVRVPAAPVATHLRNLLDAGMGWRRITHASHCSSSTISRILNGQEKVRRTVADRILAVQYRPAPGRTVNATGTRRRIQALIAIGHTITGIAAESGVDHSVINDILNGAPNVRGMTADRIAAAYDWLSRRPPVDNRPSSVTTSRNRAAREGWAPPAAWDDDEIDDPAAHPDWTGHCGTDRGWWIHSTEGIPACARCETAHAAWLADRKHLAPAERFRQLALAKGAASQRGANLAHDARELMRISGLSVDQAAQRLGVTLNHLQHELARHPETKKEAA